MRKIISLILALTLLAGPAAPAYAADGAALDRAVSGAAAYMLNTVKEPQVGSIGGEWAVLGLARSGYAVPDAYYDNYAKTVEEYVKDRGGVLHDLKYTEYSRVILGLTAAGYDPRDVAGYDLTAALGDFDKTVWQGLNGPVWALIALDSRGYPVPENAAAETQATRDMYLDEILRRQTPDGGWNLTAGANGAVRANEKADADITGMALQALAKYQDRAEVKAAADRALTCLSAMQDASGGFGSGYSPGSTSVESVVQVLAALCELGIPLDDARFVKNGKTLVDNVLSFANGDGSFKHMADGSGENQMATEQAFYGLVAAQRAAGGKNSLYRMSDTVMRGVPEPAGTAGTAETAGLPGKHADVKVAALVFPGKTFADTANHANRQAIEALAARGIIGGRNESAFDPDATVTRAEFASIITRGLGLPEKSGNVFSDVGAADWYISPVTTAYFYDILSGTPAGTFNPAGNITRQDAAAMVSRAASLCGMDAALTETEIRDTLAQFGDYRSAADYAQGALAFCYAEDILDASALDIEPAAPVTRAGIAEMLYRLLDKANLL